MGERRSISSMHVFWKEQDGTPGGWYIETRNFYGEAVADSRRISLNHPHPWELAAQQGCEARFALDRYDALGRTARPQYPPSEAASSRAELEYCPGAIEFDATGECICQTLPAWARGRNVKRLLQPKPEKHGPPGGHMMLLST